MLILNKMYAGSYPMEKNNIGHEIINLVKAIDGNFYIWLNPGGVIPEYRLKELDDGKIDVLLVRPAGKNTNKILALAKECEIDSNARGKKEKADVFKNQKDKEYRIGNKKISLGEIFINNEYHNKNDSESLLYTFKCKKVFEPKKDMYITNDDSKKNHKRNVYYFPFDFKTSLRQYKSSIDLQNKANLDKKLLYLVNDELWQELSNDKTFSKERINLINEDNFYKVINKVNDENVITNSIGNFLTLTGTVDYFVKQLYPKAGNNYQILREEFNVDLLFYSNDNNCKDIFIIENKLDSDLNGLKKPNTKKDCEKIFDEQVKMVVENYVRRYRENVKNKYDFISNRFKKIVSSFSNENKKIWSQLAKYYIFAINKLLDNDENADIKKLQNHVHSYLLIPNYRKLEIDIDANGHISEILNIKYSFANNYKLLTYDYMQELFKKINYNENRIRLNDFIEVLGQHARPYDDALENDMMSKLFKIVENKE